MRETRRITLMFAIWRTSSALSWSKDIFGESILSTSSFFQYHTLIYTYNIFCQKLICIEYCLIFLSLFYLVLYIFIYFIKHEKLRTKNNNIRRFARKRHFLWLTCRPQKFETSCCGCLKPLLLILYAFFSLLPRKILSTMFLFKFNNVE